MAGQGTRSWRSACGRLRRYYARVRVPGESIWLTVGSADSERQREAMIARVQARYPGRELAVIDLEEGRAA